MFLHTVDRYRPLQVRLFLPHCTWSVSRTHLTPRLQLQVFPPSIPAKRIIVSNDCNYTRPSSFILMLAFHGPLISVVVTLQATLCCCLRIVVKFASVVRPLHRSLSLLGRELSSCTLCDCRKHGGVVALLSVRDAVQLVPCRISVFLHHSRRVK